MTDKLEKIDPRNRFTLEYEADDFHPAVPKLPKLTGKVSLPEEPKPK